MPRRMRRHERWVSGGGGDGGGGGGGGEGGGEEEGASQERDWKSCSNRFLPAYSARSPSLLHPFRFLFRFNRLYFHFAAVGLF